MKYISFLKAGVSSYGVLKGDMVVDLGERFRREFPDLKAFIAGGGLNKSDLPDQADLSLLEIELLPVIPNPGVVWCAGMNTHSHYVEAKDHMGLTELPKAPMFFLRATNTLVASGQPLEKPLKEPAFDYEGEIAVIMGKPCRSVSIEEALDYVAGYSCFNDGSARLYQINSNQLTTGKNGYRSGGFGPCMVTSDEVELEALQLTTRVNGEVRQQMKLDDLIFSFAELISNISEVNWLQPGDVIVTGAAEGAGAFCQPAAFLTPGDVVDVEVSGIGILTNGIVEQTL